MMPSMKYLLKTLSQTHYVGGGGGGWSEEKGKKNSEGFQGEISNGKYRVKLCFLTTKK